MSGDERMLAQYQAIADTAARMLAAARESDWAALEDQERACAGLIERLRREGDRTPLDPSAARRKAALIRQVLAHDAEIRRLTQPWLARVETLLRADTNQRRVDGAYL